MRYLTMVGCKTLPMPTASLYLRIVVLGILRLSPEAEAGLCQGAAIPAYFYPGALWTTSIASVPRTAIMIMNPDSGPGASKDANYVSAVNAAQAAGIKVLGYVHTNYGSRPISQVQTEINLYKRWYGVDGIFLDQTAPSATDLAYYQSLASYIRGRNNSFVMLNPGVIPDQRYVTLADTTVVFEQSYAAYRTWVPPSWIHDYPAAKFTHLVHTTTTSAQMASAIELSRSRNAGLVYVTHDIPTNPWDSLPIYWQTELITLTTKCPS
ncbi:spherulation-specific family 4 protein [uncultured Thiodictyon sp.]|uniref:spherulation-specific family 4 protein n=1 Tax=uncultured Thiodictyon sp. TaxID=1846217 RepID=UPI0025D658F0|nr:spherulation-specific family 4 protein [uncultured Thiodictyon sp.]